MMLTGSEIICECLIEQGVDTVFGYPGGTILNVYDALYRYQDKINHVLTSHEQGASLPLMVMQEQQEKLVFVWLLQDQGQQTLLLELRRLIWIQHHLLLLLQMLVLKS